MCATRIIPASVFRFCLRDENPFAKEESTESGNKLEVLMGTICDKFRIFLHVKKHISNSSFRWSAFGVVFSTACFAVSKFAIWRANRPLSFGALEAISGNDVVALLTPAVAVSLLLIKFALEARLIRHCLPLSSLVSRCVYFIAKTWSCVVQRAQEQLLYGQALLSPFNSSILPRSLHFPQVLPDIVVFNGEVKPMQYTFSKLTLFAGQDLFIYSDCCEMP